MTLTTITFVATTLGVVVCWGLAGLLFLRARHEALGSGAQADLATIVSLVKAGFGVMGVGAVLAFVEWVVAR